MKNTTLPSGWEFMRLLDLADRKTTPGTFRAKSKGRKPFESENSGSRPYGGRPMSVARLYATGPTRQITPIKTQGDITL